MSNNHHEAVYALMSPHRMIGPGSDGQEYPPSEHNIEMAKVWATMALAHEHRTANLIATFGQLLDGDSNTFLGERIDGYELAKQIKERLELE